MKKILPFVLTALISIACAAPPTNREATNSGSTNKAAETTTAPLTEAEAMSKEKEIWQMIQKQDLNAFAAGLAEEQIYISSDGVHDKAATIKGVTGFKPTDVVFSDWKFIPIDKDAVVNVYTVSLKTTTDGKTADATAHASSVWINRGGKWVSVFHQDCEAVKQPPPPPAKTGAQAAASPAAASTPAATTSDVVANEKAVWAALTAKQWNVFESYLAPDSLEVEPIGIMDRAESVKGVQGFDFSKSTLSDWKTVRIDDDASIVTYTGHFPGQKPNTEYHSTVWANRGGKWLAVFHHGTPMAPAQPAPAAKPTGTK
jgi:hypothetical protein